MGKEPGSMTLKNLRLALILVSLLFLPGCAAVALTAGGIAGGTGVSHTLNGIAYKTFTASLGEIRVATLRALNRMEIKVAENAESEEGWKILATAKNREIEIELEELTPKTTRMRVVANKDAIIKDAATATEIIIQTVRILDAQAARAAKKG
jgi:hypothetical protein